ncbi:MAG TPA: DUF952 domain-containing protein [Acidimicrobiia bacterium]|nr:DUF952 domain-containing protein [Acidimicrobiia bacterium]
MARLILHITTRPAWDEAQQRGSYTPASLESEGFVHCSLPTQVTHVADWFYRDVPDLMLLCIDPNRLTAALRWERSEEEAFPGDFPHIYGPVDLAAVVEAVPWARGEDGFALPAEIRHLLDG